MDKSLDKTWEIALAAVSAHAWLAVPLVVGAMFIYKLPEFAKECLFHRRQMWKMKATEQQRRETVELRRRRAAEKRKRQP